MELAALSAQCSLELEQDQKFKHMPDATTCASCSHEGSASRTSLYPECDSASALHMYAPSTVQHLPHVSEVGEALHDLERRAAVQSRADLVCKDDLAGSARMHCSRQVMQAVAGQLKTLPLASSGAVGCEQKTPTEWDPSLQPPPRCAARSWGVARRVYSVRTGSKSHPTSISPVVRRFF